MKKLNIAIIGQGRSGRDIHGKYYRSEKNVYYNVKYVVEADADEVRVGFQSEVADTRRVRVHHDVGESVDVGENRLACAVLAGEKVRRVGQLAPALIADRNREVGVPERRAVLVLAGNDADLAPREGNAFDHILEPGRIRPGD